MVTQLYLIEASVTGFFFFFLTVSPFDQVGGRVSGRVKWKAEGLCFLATRGSSRRLLDHPVNLASAAG